MWSVIGYSGGNIRPFFSLADYAVTRQPSGASRRSPETMPSLNSRVSKGRWSARLLNICRCGIGQTLVVERSPFKAETTARFVYHDLLCPPFQFPTAHDSSSEQP
jgi:hypothetical protein